MIYRTSLLRCCVVVSRICGVVVTLDVALFFVSCLDTRPNFGLRSVSCVSKRGIVTPCCTRGTLLRLDVFFMYCFSRCHSDG